MRVTYSGPALITASTEISERGRLRHYGALRSDNVIVVERERVLRSKHRNPSRRPDPAATSPRRSHQRVPASGLVIFGLWVLHICVIPEGVGPVNSGFLFVIFLLAALRLPLGAPG